MSTRGQDLLLRAATDRTLGTSLMTSAKASSIAIVLPAHNEEDSIEIVITESLRVLKCFGTPFEIIIVDNNSSDGTGRIAETFAARDPRISCISNRESMGTAPSTLKGLMAAESDLLMVLPSDRQVMPDQLLPCLATMGDADIVWTHRFARADPLVRRITSAAYNILVRRLFRLPVHDIDSCFLIRRDAIEVIGTQITEKTGFIPVELLCRALSLGMKIREVRIEHHRRVAGRQEGLDVVHTMHVFGSLARFWWRSSRHRGGSK